jgi:hypothetical protein
MECAVGHHPINQQGWHDIYIYVYICIHIGWVGGIRVYIYICTYHMECAVGHHPINQQGWHDFP